MVRKSPPYRLVFSLVRLLIFSLLLGANPVQAAEVNLPELGDSSESVLSLAEERKLGAAFMRQIRRQLPVVDDPLIKSYIKSLGGRLLSHIDTLGREFEFFVVGQSSINAFAAPGGYIGVNSGLILATRSESELAAVLAHEIAHVTQRHAARSFEAANQASLPVAAAILAAVLLGPSGDLGQAAIMGTIAGSQQYRLNFTRTNEQEADRLGMQMLAAEKFDPYGMPGFFERLARATRLYGGEVMEFLSTHPVTSSRISDSRGRATQLGYQPHIDTLEYQLTRERLRVLLGERPEHMVAAYRSALTSGHYASKQATKYGLGLALLKSGEFIEAHKVLSNLYHAVPEQPALLIALAESYSADNKLVDAKRLLLKGRALYPTHPALVDAYAGLLIGEQAWADAEKVLRDAVRQRPGDLALYKELAHVLGNRGRLPESRYYQAEYHRNMGESRIALEQVELALGELEDEPYLQARLEALQVGLQEELKPPPGLEESPPSRR